MFCRTLSLICCGLALIAAMQRPCLAADGTADSASLSIPRQSGIIDLLPAVVPAPQNSSEPPVSPPPTSLSHKKRARFEHRGGMAEVLEHQWMREKPLPPGLQSRGPAAKLSHSEKTGITLKQALYVAIRNNPGLRAEMLEPEAALEAVRQANAAFDPNLDSKASAGKTTVPVITNFYSVGQETFARKEWDWSFGVSKLLSTTNGTLSIGLDNSRISSNARDWMVNPSYNPELAFSLSQPLLRNFGLGFATINVRLAQSGHLRAQYTFEQKLSDFVLETATDYWNVVRALENVQVNKGALELAQDTVNFDAARLKMGMAARIDVQESQSALESWRAALSSATNELATAQAVLRAQVMLNPGDALVPELIEPVDVPGNQTNVNVDATSTLDLAMANRPELGALRESIREQMLHVRFAENQTLPQLTLGANFGISAVSGTAGCTRVSSSVNLGNCALPGGTGPRLGTQLPLGGTYADALGRLLNAGFYRYAIGLTLEIPLSNDYANAGLAQAKIEADQARLRYRDQLSKIVVEVQSSLSTLTTAADRAHTTKAAADYARAALEAENARYRTGVADTHELLQYQQELISALAHQVQAQVDFEIARLMLTHAEGTLLNSFQINFAVEPAHDTPWYARF